VNSLTLYYRYVSANSYMDILNFVCTDQVENIVVYTIFDGKATSRQIEGIVEKQKEFSKKRRTKFRNHAVFNSSASIDSNLKKALLMNGFVVELMLEETSREMVKNGGKIANSLNRYGIQNKLWVNETSDQQAAYRLFEQNALPVNFIEPQYCCDLTTWFDEWLYNKSSVAVNTFTDIIMMLTLQTRSGNCRFGSCLGNTFYVDETMTFYMCPFRRDIETCLGKMEGLANPFEMFETENVYSIVCNSVDKRANCAENCSNFAYCQGGCAVSNASDCQMYIKLVEHIGDSMRHIYDNRKLEDVNSVVKNAILNAVAFGSAFFK